MYDTETMERALGRVSAPEELWRRIEQARAPRPVRRTRRLVWAIASAALFAGIAWNLPRPEFRSEDPAAMRAWVRERTGIDLPFVAHPVSARLTAASATRRGVEIRYRSEGGAAEFTVSKASPGETAHWSSGGRAYVLACANPVDLDAACRLCHI